MPTHAKSLIEKGYEFLLLQVVTANWRVFGVNRQFPLCSIFRDPLRK